MSTDQPAEIESVIACLGDDAAKLLDANPDDEIAANMVHAAALLGQLQGALNTACVQLEGWVSWKCPARHRAEHEANIAKLRAVGGL